MPVKFSIIGAGSTYTPELIDGLITYRDKLPVDHICLMDIDESRLNIVAGMARRMIEKAGLKAQIETTTDRRRAISDADFIVTQIRVGGMAARIQDEKIPLEFGVIGQETTGPGGFMKALRTIPVMLDIAKEIAELAPDAWLINFTNPSGIITEALLRNSRIKTIGLCNAPTGVQKAVAEKYGVSVEDVSLNYIGLNHLSWIDRITVKGEDVTVKAIEHILEERPEEDRVIARDYHMWMSGYLRYYYFRDKALAEMMAAEKTRGELILDIDAELMKIYQDVTVAEKPEQLMQRGGKFYSLAAIRLAGALFNNTDELQVVNVRNENTIPALPFDSVIETTCRINSDGAHPLPVGKLPVEIRGLVQAVKSYEELTVRAAVNGSREDALHALLAHPLIPSYTVATALLDRLLEANRQYLPQFFKS